MRGASATLGLALLAAACAESHDARERAAATLGEGSVAKVGAETVAGSTVKRIATTQGVSLEEALELAIHDATLAAAAREDLPSGIVARLETQVLAWALLREVADEAASVPLSEQELADVTDSSWTRYDRPEGRQVIHVVVRTDDEPSAQERTRRRALADDLLAAIQPLQKRARATEAVEVGPEELYRWLPSAQHDPIQEPFEQAVGDVVGELPKFVKVELLPPVAANGYLVQHELNDIRLSPAFVEAAMQLDRRGDIAGVVESPFGYHVMVLVRRTEPLRVPRERRLRALSPIVEKWRGRQTSAKLLAKGRADVPVDQARNRLAWMRQVSFEDQAP